jgi:hypothetical protein
MMKVSMIVPAMTMALACAVAPASAQTPPIPADLQNPMIEIQYVEPSNEAFRPIREKLMQYQVLERLKQFLAPLILPNKVVMKVDECGPTPQYPKPSVPVVVCYEYIKMIEERAPGSGKETSKGVSRDDVIIGTFVMAALHETARAVFSELKIPIWGREEDAADKLAAFVMVEMGGDIALRSIKGTASFFRANPNWSGSDFDYSEVASPEKQRYYNYLCIAYGSDPDTFKQFARNTLLTTRRAQRCSGEYIQVKSAFEATILNGHVDQALLQKVQSVTTWLPPTEGKLAQ